MSRYWLAIVGALLLVTCAVLSVVDAREPDRGPGRLASFWTSPQEEPPQDEAEEDQSLLIRRLTPSEINRIRFLELKSMRSREGGVESVSVNIPRETIQEFLVEMEGEPDFNTREKRGEFLKLTAPQKLQIIARYKGEKYADRVEIRSDPEVFVEFRKRIMPVVLRTCATTACHATSNEDAAGFALYKDPKKSAPTTYANFLVLNELAVDGARMIDRGNPDQSLLLTYLLPPLNVKPEQRHPGDVEYKPVFTSEKNPRFRRIRDWIGSLNHPAVDYQVRILPDRTPASQPAEPPASAGTGATP